MTTESGITDAQVEYIDNWMDDHMYRHAISNNFNGMSCDVRCRRQAIKMAVDRALAEKGEEVKDDD
jgi:hypothetical protein